MRGREGGREGEKPNIRECIIELSRASRENGAACLPRLRTDCWVWKGELLVWGLLLLPLTGQILPHGTSASWHFCALCYQPLPVEVQEKAGPTLQRRDGPCGFLMRTWLLEQWGLSPSPHSALAGETEAGRVRRSRGGSSQGPRGRGGGSGEQANWVHYKVMYNFLIKWYAINLLLDK